MKNQDGCIYLALKNYLTRCEAATRGANRCLPSARLPRQLRSATPSEIKLGFPLIDSVQLIDSLPSTLHCTKVRLELVFTFKKSWWPSYLFVIIFFCLEQ